MNSPAEPSAPRGGWRAHSTDTAASRNDGPPKTPISRLPRADVRAAARTSTTSDPVPDVDAYAPTASSPAIVSVPGPATATNPGTSMVPRKLLAMAIVSCALCLPLGVWSVIESQRVNAFLVADDRASANTAAARARTIALAGIGIGLAAIVLSLTVVVL